MNVNTYNFRKQNFTLISAAVYRAKTRAAGAQEVLIWELWMPEEGGLDREGGLFLCLMPISCLSGPAFLKYLYQEVEEFSCGSSENAVPQNSTSRGTVSPPVPALGARLHYPEPCFS